MVRQKFGGFIPDLDENSLQDYRQIPEDEKMIVMLRVVSSQFDEPSHDYDPIWDYEPDEDVDAGIRNDIDQYISKLESELLPQLGLFKKIAIHFTASFDELGRYVDGTYTQPVIMLNLARIVAACREYNLDCPLGVQTTILHELGHAIQEATGKPMDEDTAERFAKEYYETGRIVLP